MPKLENQKVKSEENPLKILDLQRICEKRRLATQSTNDTIYIPGALYGELDFDT
jgi:hypothetical protein